MFSLDKFRASRLTSHTAGPRQPETRWDTLRAATGARKFGARIGRVAIVGLCWGMASAVLAQTSDTNAGDAPSASDPSANPNPQSPPPQSPNAGAEQDWGNQNIYPPQRISQPNAISNGSNQILTLQQLLSANNAPSSDATLVRQPPKPSEFENYIERLLGRKVPLFGTKLVLPALRDFAAPATATVPPDYVVQPGDQINVALSGSLESSVEREVDTNGKIFLRGVGAVRVAGVRNSDLQDVIARAIGTKFRGFTASVTITKLRGIRVYVTGLANNPGAFTVSSLSTLANAVFQAGGPNAGGSWRTIKLYRNGQQLADFDLYQLMRGGSRVNDVQLQNEDVLFIPPAGPQIAVIGSVREEAIYEAKSGESVADMLAAAGGPNTVGDPAHFVLYQTGDPERAGPQQFASSLAPTTPVATGEIIQVLSIGTLTMPIARQKVLVRVEGEVQTPGIYYVPPGTTFAEIVAQAGGLTPKAYAFGTKFTRPSVQIQQQASYKEALDQLEVSLTAAPLSQDPTVSAGDRGAQLSAARAVLTRLREARPDGRVVLRIAPDATTLPGDVVLENNDSLYVPPLASTVGVFGAVYHPSSFLVDSHHKARRVRDYVEEAGGRLRSADKGGIFVVRANGEVVSAKRGALNATVLAGDVIFVPTRTQPNLFWARLRDISTMLLSLGLTIATVVAVTK